MTMEDPYVFIFNDAEDMRNALSKAIEELGKLEGVHTTTDNTETQWIFLNDKHHVIGRLKVDSDQKCLALGDLDTKRATDMKYIFANAAQQYSGMEACEVEAEPIRITDTLGIQLVASKDDPDILIVAFDGPSPPNDAFREHLNNLIQTALQNAHINTDYDLTPNAIIITHADTFGQEHCDNSTMAEIAANTIQANIKDLQKRATEAHQEEPEPAHSSRPKIKQPAKSKADAVITVKAAELLPTALKTLQKSAYQSVISQDDIAALSQHVASFVAKKHARRPVITKDLLAVTVQECLKGKMHGEKVWEFLVDDLAQSLLDTYKQVAEKKTLANGGLL